ncbi:SMP-30/gluconolactonase/LRE family protein [Krasilnikovia sp. M28-CT-15]|uniref:SMP-30/gluconolactonase/LRE family protein n=1 Tax=Krasilnikovia sp. M28-CT-15 TaxID=3373540 RepID=UPI0038776C7E
MSGRTLAIVALAVAGVTALTPPASAHPAPAPDRAAALPAVRPTPLEQPSGPTFAGPAVLRLPDGFAPEGIAIGATAYAYFGSRVDGDIYRVNLRTGRGRTISQGPGTGSLGMKLDARGRLFVAGGSGGDARVLDAATGRVLRSYRLQHVPAFINDVVLAGGSAWFTDSVNPVLFRLPLGAYGELPTAATAVPLSGDIRWDPASFNANGITATPDGRGLIIVQSGTGLLFRVNHDGVTRRIDLGGESVPNGDGMWLRGRTLYVVQNRLNRIAKIKLDRRATRGTVLSRTSDPRFDVPTTIAEFGDRFYLPNARFTTPQLPDTSYTAVAVPRP